MYSINFSAFKCLILMAPLVSPSRLLVGVKHIEPCRRVKIHRTLTWYLLDSAPSEDRSQLVQAAGTSGADAGNGHTHKAPDVLVAWVRRLKVQQFQKAATSVRQFADSVSDVLLFLCLYLNIFHVYAGIGRFFKVLFRAGLTHTLRPDMNALSCRRGDQPRTNLGFVL